MKNRKAVWAIDYLMHNDKCFDRPSCPDCKEPIFKNEDGKYHCICCSKVVTPDEKQLEWLKLREERKVEIQDCPEHEFEFKGEKIKMGCGGKDCVEVHFRRNPITLEWQTAWGVCNNCGKRFIV